jgi:hypothetical protein
MSSCESPSGPQKLEGSIPSTSTFCYADFLEHFAEHLELEYEIWAMFHAPAENKEDWEEKIAPIEEFVDWVKKETEKALHVKRGREGTSFFERRELARSGRSSLSNAEGTGSTNDVLVQQPGELCGGDLPASS